MFALLHWRQLYQEDVLVVNSSHWMSEIGARLAPDCDFAVIWYYDHDDKRIKVSLRAFHDRIDVSEVSKKYKGGGHKKAAGFTFWRINFRRRSRDIFHGR